MFYGWYIVGGVFIAQLFLTGFMTYSFGLYVEPLEADFGASRAEVMLSMTYVTMIGLFISPIFGWMVDRYPVRWLMSIGALLFSAGLYALSLANSMVAFALIFAVAISVCNMLLGPLTGSATISRWFARNRGKALGISAVGVSVGGIVLPQLLGHWIETINWRVSLQYLAYANLAIVFPYLLVLMRGKPEDKGMHPDGEAPTGEAAAQAAASEYTLKQLLKHPAYWSIGICLGLLFSAYSTLMANMVPYAMGAGFDAQAAARLMPVIAGAGLVGKILFGMAADKMSLKLGLWLAIGLVMFGMAILLTNPAYPLMVVASALIGLAAGGMLPVWGAILAAVFGLASYGRVMGLMQPLITLCIMPGFPLTGYLFDRSGSYDTAFMMFIGVLVVAALALVPLKMPGQGQTAGN